MALWRVSALSLRAMFEKPPMLKKKCAGLDVEEYADSVDEICVVFEDVDSAGLEDIDVEVDNRVDIDDCIGVTEEVRYVVEDTDRDDLDELVSPGFVEDEEVTEPENELWTDFEDDDCKGTDENKYVVCEVVVWCECEEGDVCDMTSEDVVVDAVDTGVV
ncbi:hypothetical protein SLS53_007208 [Cytospora paraplurivora]|uniref:Uncharacterized protein n=1 Tax=Cytospora paraplurivora TaxID=2898453 RepID=A0AAN9U1V3_9PEZI